MSEIPKSRENETWDETLARLDAHERDALAGKVTWGDWSYDPNRLTLDLSQPIEGGSFGYEVDLERCTSSAQVLDWIAQVAGKGWVTNENVGQLVQALDDLLNLQSNMCSMGVDYEINPVEVLRRTPGEHLKRYNPEKYGTKMNGAGKFVLVEQEKKGGDDD